MTFLIATLVVVTVLALWFELRAWRKPGPSNGGPDGVDHMRSHVEGDVELGHSWRSGYSRERRRR